MLRSKIYLLTFLCVLATPSFAEGNPAASIYNQQEILMFQTMYAVDGAFLTPQGETQPNIRDIPGDYQAWKINKFIKGKLYSNGKLMINVQGLVFPDAPNDEANFRALVSCLTDESGQIVTQNVITAPFPTGREGNANIQANLKIPNPCVAPIVMILNGDPAEGNVWFAVTGW